MPNPFIPTPEVRTVEQLINDFAGPLPEQIKLVNLIYSLAALAGGSVSWDDISDKPETFPPVIGTTATTAKAGNYTPPDAAAATRGLVLQGTSVADATDETDVVAQFNALLASLRSAGVLAA